MNKKYLLLGFLTVILGTLLLKRCDNKKIKEITDEHLKSGEKTAIIMDTDTGQITTIIKRNLFILRGGDSSSPQTFSEVVKRIDGARNLRISIDAQGKVTYIFRTWGFEFSPGVGAYYSSGHTGVTLNDSFFFYRKHEALIGLRFALTGSKEIRPYIGYAYNPKFKYFSNTSLVFGIDLDKNFIISTNTKF